MAATSGASRGARRGVGMAAGRNGGGRLLVTCLGCRRRPPGSASTGHDSICPSHEFRGAHIVTRDSGSGKPRSSTKDMAPKGWKEEILGSIDIEILSQVLDSGSKDTQYLGQIMQYSLDMVRKLSGAAKEDEMKKSHDTLLSELAASSEVDDNGVSSFVIAVIKGLRFTLEEIKELQAEVSKAHIQLMQPMIGSAGVEYLQKAFEEKFNRYSNKTSLVLASKRTVEAPNGLLR